MYRELSYNDVVYKFNTQDVRLESEVTRYIEYKDAYPKIENALQIDEWGYNIYMVDEFSREKKKNLINFIKETYADMEPSSDICYAIYEDSKVPKPIFLKNGMGKNFIKTLEELQKKISTAIFEFYNSSVIEEKEMLLEYISDRKNQILSELIDNSREEGFEIRTADNGFTFIPLKDGEVMTEQEYDELGHEEREDIIKRVNELKKHARQVLTELQEIEDSELDKIKEILVLYMNDLLEDFINKCDKEFEDNGDASEYYKFVADNSIKKIIESCTMNYEEDEEMIAKAIYRYAAELIVDNSENESPPVIFEENPTMANLLGSVEHESSSNSSSSPSGELSKIKAGSLIKANGGCLIVKAKDLFNNASSYHYLIKSLVSGKVDLNYNKGYFELLAVSGVSPEPIKANVKVIIIGDFYTFDTLYNLDEDFRKIFKMRIESNPLVEVDENSAKKLSEYVSCLCINEKLKPLTESAIKEIAKYLARKAGNSNQLKFDVSEIRDLVVRSTHEVKKRGGHSIDGQDILAIAYPEELIEKQILEPYKNKKMIVTVRDKCVGEINGLSVIDLGYLTFGRPMRITCTAYKGSGRIIDVQNESDMSGKIHKKSINILKGFMMELIGGYEELPVDLHLSFEQLYGSLDGDSASVAEALCMISAISKIPLKQNISITGSINQFGEVQAIGGVNEKIEGFYKVCNLIDSSKGKGVLIPESNADDLVLSEEVEEEMRKRNFKIFTMNSIRDAIELMMCDEKVSVDDVLEEMKKELKKYVAKNNQKKKEK